MLNAKKGQIFSLDFLLSLSIIIVLLGILLNSYELGRFSMQEGLSQKYLYLLAYSASQRLVSADEMLCNILDENGNNIPGFKLTNCLNPSRTISKQQLGIPSSVKCKISGINVQGCNDTIDDKDKRITITRKVFLANDISKKELYECMQDMQCNYDANISITLAWRE